MGYLTGNFGFFKMKGLNIEVLMFYFHAIITIILIKQQIGLDALNSNLAAKTPIKRMETAGLMQSIFTHNISLIDMLNV